MKGLVREINPAIFPQECLCITLTGILIEIGSVYLFIATKRVKHKQRVRVSQTLIFSQRLLAHKAISKIV